MDKFEIGNSALYCGDSFEILPTLTDGSIDLICSDPPYAAESFGGKCTACEWDTPINLTTFWQLLESKAKPSANVVLFANMKFAFDLIDSNRKGFRYDLVWAKNNRVGFFNANLMPLRSHENVLLFGKPGFQKMATYNPLKTPGGRPVVKRARSRGGGVYPAQESYTTVSDGTIHPISVLAFDHDRGGNQSEKCLHPTMKPLHLMGWLVFTYSNPGDLIVDPFCGSGTTLEAALRLGRRFIGIERERKYFDIACQRLEEVQRKWKIRFDGNGNRI